MGDKKYKPVGDAAGRWYSEEFLVENIQSYGSIPGVFTITQQNATIKAEVDKKTTEKHVLDSRIKTICSTISEESEKQKKSIPDSASTIKGYISENLYCHRSKPALQHDDESTIRGRRRNYYLTKADLYPPAAA